MRIPPPSERAVKAAKAVVAFIDSSLGVNDKSPGWERVLVVELARIIEANYEEVE